MGESLAQLDWQLSSIDVEGIARAHQQIEQAFAKAGIADFRYLQGEFDKSLAGADSGGHHMGTTRMHSSPSYGVVDENCKVNDMDNLYIAGSSVFPSAGYANPILTVVAMAIRLV